MKTDVVVVGAGAAGLMAALTAAEGGADVTLLERSPVFGGTSAHAGGGMWLPNNSFQAKAGIPDTVADAETYLRRLTLGMVSEELMQAFIREAPRAFDLLAKETALEFVFLGFHDGPAFDSFPELPGAGLGRAVGPQPYDMSRLGALRQLVRRPDWPRDQPPLSYQEYAAFLDRQDYRGWVALAKDRIAKGIAGKGHALVAGLLEACVGKGVKLVPNARGSALTQDNGRVTGIMVSQESKLERYEARLGVVLACGGYEWNTSMWDDLTQIPLDGRFSPPLNEGDGLRMAMQAGARVGRLHQGYLLLTIGAPPILSEGRPRLRLEVKRLPLPGSIAVNRRGQRFANEADHPSRVTEAMVQFDANTWEYPNLPAYLVFDRLNRESYPLLFDDWSADADSEPDWLFEAQTLRALAEKIGVDPSGLEEQVKSFNLHAERGEDPVFKRGATLTQAHGGDPRRKYPTLRPIGPGPYYAYRLQLGAWGTRGGPIVNGNAQVVGLDNRHIPGLYAVGTCAASVTGTAYPSGGSSLGPGMTLGYMAGRSLISSGLVSAR